MHPARPSTRYELLLTHYGRSAASDLARFLADASRTARQNVTAATHRERALVDVAAGVAAPALFGYVLWLLREAQKHQIRRLYFLSRDGHILLQIARHLHSLFPCELPYLYGSRAAWTLPSLTEFDDNLLNRILPLDHLYTVESSFQRLGLDPETVIEDLQRIALPPTQWRSHLNPKQRQRLRGLLQSSTFQELIRNRAQCRRPMLLAYLQQEGFCDGISSALVDLGWQGSIQNALGRVLAGESSPRLHGFYYGISGGEPDNSVNGVRQAYLGDARCEEGAEAIIDAVFMPLELFCVADHGTVIDYQISDGRVQPILDTTVNAPLVAWGFPLMQQTIQRFMEALVPSLPADSLNDPVLEADLRPVIIDVINTFWRSPSSAEASVWGDYWCEERLQRYQLAPPYNSQHLLQALVHGKIVRTQTFWWHEGSLTRSPLATRLPLTLLTTGGRMAKRLHRWYRHR